MLDNYLLIGGHPTLDFINTVDNQDKHRTMNSIASWSNFINWCQASSMFNSEQLFVLKNNVSRSEGATLLIEILEIRELFFHALKSLMNENISQNWSMEKLETLIKKAINNSSLIKREGRVEWVTNTNTSDWIVDLLILSMENLLCHEDLTRLRQCKRCTWLFLNSGRGRGRQWCSMKTCGNRAKSAAFRDKNH